MYLCNCVYLCFCVLVLIVFYCLCLLFFFSRRIFFVIVLCLFLRVCVMLCCCFLVFFFLLFVCDVICFCVLVWWVLLLCLLLLFIWVFVCVFVLVFVLCVCCDVRFGCCVGICVVEFWCCCVVWDDVCDVLWWLCVCGVFEVVLVECCDCVRWWVMRCMCGWWLDDGWRVFMKDGVDVMECGVIIMNFDVWVVVGCICWGGS